MSIHSSSDVMLGNLEVIQEIERNSVQYSNTRRSCFHTYLSACQSVNLSTKNGSPCGHYPWCIGNYWKGPHPLFQFPLGHQTRDPSPHLRTRPPLVLTYDGRQSAYCLIILDYFFVVNCTRVVSWLVFTFNMVCIEARIWYYSGTHTLPWLVHSASASALVLFISLCRVSRL